MIAHADRKVNQRVIKEIGREIDRQERMEAYRGANEKNREKDGEEIKCCREDKAR